MESEDRKSSVWLRTPDCMMNMFATKLRLDLDDEGGWRFECGFRGVYITLSLTFRSRTDRGERLKSLTYAPSTHTVLDCVA